MGDARSAGRYDLICFSHLRWDFVYQRPQHLLARAARGHRVFFIEEPLYDRSPPHLAMRRSVEGVLIVQPTLPRGTPAGDVPGLLRELIDHLIEHLEIVNYALWFSTPIALPFAHHLAPCGVVYDYLPEHGGGRVHPSQLELRLLGAADVVFTAGESQCEARRDHHANVHAFPNPIEVEHFAQARRAHPAPADQAAITGIRVGFAGPIDRRTDLALLSDLAALRPDLQLVMLGPIVRPEVAQLPDRANLHWLGARTHADLPRYLAGWQCAILPFAQNDATRLLDPPTPLEYLAAGLPVVSTAIDDVVHPYRDLGLVHVASDAAGMSAAIDAALAETAASRWRAADRWMARQSWDRTWADMEALIDRAIEARTGALDELAPRHRLPALATAAMAL